MDFLTEYLKMDTPTEIIAQIIGVLALIVSMSSFQMRTHKKIVTFQIVSCSLFAIHFLMLGAHTGALLNFIAAVRSAVFANKDKKWAKSNLWLVFFSIVCIIAVAFSWEGCLSLLPMAGMILTTISFGIENPKAVRFISFPSSPLWMIYNFVKHSYAGVLTETFVMCSIIIAIIRLDILKIQPKNKAEK